MWKRVGRIARVGVGGGQEKERGSETCCPRDRLQKADSDRFVAVKSLRSCCISFARVSLFLSRIASMSGSVCHGQHVFK
jgi:hypothetical protein